MTFKIFFIVLVFSFFSSATKAEDEFVAKDCDEIVSLRNGDMLCWYESSKDKKFGYHGKIFKNGKFLPLEDGVYTSKRSSRSFRVQDGNVLFHKARAYLTKEDGSINHFADFYKTNFEGLQIVYICTPGVIISDNKGKKVACHLAGSKKYKTTSGVSFETKNGFLPKGCYYDSNWGGVDKAELVCEDVD